MDLEAETQRLRLDLLAVELSACLTGAGIPHALIKGPTTSLWLYDPPRAYNDVDLLVPATRLLDAAAALTAAGLVMDGLGATGAEGSHSHTLHSTAGYEVDLHTSLPTLPAREDDVVWDAVGSDLTTVDLGVGTVPALGEAARCLVIALHAVPALGRLDQREEDLRRAEAQASAETWQRARELAVTLGAVDLFDAGRLRLDPEPDTRAMSSRAYLEFTGGSPYAISVDRLMSAHGLTRLRLLGQELWPSAAFLEANYPDLAARPAGVIRARLVRFIRIGRLLPSILRETRRAVRRG